MNLGNNSRRVLLTGAGISRNWGGKLAHEVWEDVVGHRLVRDHSRVREVVLAEPSFELALAKVRAGEYTDQEKRAIEHAVFDAFRAMDRQISDVQSASSRSIDVYRFQKLLSRFAWEPSGTVNTGFIFTTNQDLLLERRWYNFHHGQASPVHPGIPAPPLSIRSNLHFFGTNLPEFSDDLVSRVDWNGEPPYLGGRINYIKLHGSFNWLNEDGSRTMVMGSQKAQQISGHPLLGWYFDVFKEVMGQKGVRLMVIGYSFADEHINAVIAEAVRDHGCQVFFWDTYFGTLKQRLLDSDDGKVIYDGLLSSCQRPFSEVFERDTDTAELVRIYDTMFDGVPV